VQALARRRPASVPTAFVILPGAGMQRMHARIGQAAKARATPLQEESNRSMQQASSRLVRWHRRRPRVAQVPTPSVPDRDASPAFWLRASHALAMQPLDSCELKNSEPSDRWRMALMPAARRLELSKVRFECRGCCDNLPMDAWTPWTPWPSQHRPQYCFNASYSFSTV
jgi:hypothetical protein